MCLGYIDIRIQRHGLLKELKESFNYDQSSSQFCRKGRVALSTCVDRVQKFCCSLYSSSTTKIRDRTNRRKSRSSVILFPLFASDDAESTSTCFYSVTASNILSKACQQTMEFRPGICYSRRKFTPFSENKANPHTTGRTSTSIQRTQTKKEYFPGTHRSDNRSLLSRRKIQCSSNPTDNTDSMGWSNISRRL